MGGGWKAGLAIGLAYAPGMGTASKTCSPGAAGTCSCTFGAGAGSKPSCGTEGVACWTFMGGGWSVKGFGWEKL